MQKTDIKKTRGGAGRNQGNKPKFYSEEVKERSLKIPTSKLKEFRELARKARKEVLVVVPKMNAKKVK
jgi:hypothetical protein